MSPDTPLDMQETIIRIDPAAKRAYITSTEVSRHDRLLYLGNLAKAKKRGKVIRDDRDVTEIEIPANWIILSTSKKERFAHEQF